jgi:hypothetical protein
VKRAPVSVTDHAVLRYLERLHGLDIEAVRAEIASTVWRAALAGATGVRHGGLIYRLQDGVVVTVTPLSHEPLPGRSGEPEDEDGPPRTARMTRRERARLKGVKTRKFRQSRVDARLPSGVLARVLGGDGDDPA